MGKRIRIAPSILSADFSRLGDEIRAVEAAGADLIHIDVMDGHFVPNITIGPLVVNAVRPVTSLQLDVHLMIENPDAYLKAFAEAGADWLTVHIETCPHLNRTISKIKELGIKAGVSLNPATHHKLLEYCIADVDMVLVMSVNPGFGGQHFIPASLQKIHKIREMADKSNKNLVIEVDGGINEQTIAQVVAAGADIVVAGSAVFGKTDYKTRMEVLRRTADA
ncbi:MAG: ribulose-phosphate 3-epimerase [Dissulfuribacterales bacterium]